MSRRLPFTAVGWVLLATAAACYVVGALLGYRLLAAVALGLVVLLAVAACWVVLQPRVELVRTVEPERVSVGDAALGCIDVRNRSRLPSVPFAAVDRIGAESVAVAVGTLRGAGLRRVYYPVPTTRRGRIALGPLTVERRDPLGLLRRARRVASPAVLWVHPRTHRAAPLPVGIVLDYEARNTANARVGTLTFSSLRDYVPGDDPRRIHWRTTARAGHLIVKEHIDTTEPTTTVLLDNVSLADLELFEEAVEVAASLYRSVELTGRPVGLHCVHDEPVPDALTAFDVLATVAPRPDSGRDLFDRLERMPPGGALVVITAADPAALPRLADQRRRFNPVVVIQFAAPRDPTPDSLRRRPGMATITARRAADAIGQWNHLTGGQAE